MGQNKNIKRFNLFIILGVAGIILCYGFAMTLLTFTIVKPLFIIFISLGIAMASALPFTLKWNNSNSQKGVIIKTGCYIVGMTGVFMALILGINYWAKKSSETYTYEANIEKIFSETAYRRKRVGNRYYANGEPYKKYYMVVAMPDGKSKKFPISTESYNKYVAISHMRKKRPKNIQLNITPGAFGWHVIDPLKL